MKTKGIDQRLKKSPRGGKVSHKGMHAVRRAPPSAKQHKQLSIALAKNNDDALREAQDKLQAYLDITGAILIALDANQKVTLINRKGCAILGRAREDIIGKKWSTHFIPRHARSEANRTFKKMAKGVMQGYENLESTLLTKDGGERTIAWNNNIWKNKRGKFTGILSSGEDITDRKIAEETLKASEVRYRRLFESAKDGILILDFETGLIVDVNPFLIHLLGYDYTNLIQKHIWDIGIFKDTAASKKAFLELQKKSYIRYEDLPLSVKDGKNIDVEFVSNVYLVNGKKVIQCNIRDITEQKQIDRTKTEFISLAAHQFRTPLTTIGLTVELLSNEIIGSISKDGKDYILDILNDVGYLTELINTFLNVSRFELGVFNIQIEPIALDELITDQLKEFHVLLKEKNLRLRKKIDRNLPLLKLDSRIIHIAVENLLSNALKYTLSGGTITLQITKKMKEIRISVTDTGIGIPKEDQPHVFSKLYRASNVASGKIEGVGLGLYLAKQLLEYGGAALTFTSTEGTGSTFTISLPQSGMKKKKGKYIPKEA